MKKLFLALLAVASVGTANAQKNTFLLYGNAGVDYMNNDNGAAGSNRNTMWNVNPGVGFQFNHHLTVGLQGGYGENKNVNEMTTIVAPIVTTKNTNRMREWQAGVFFRYTQPLGGIFSIFTQLDLSYLNGHVEMESITPNPLGGSLVVNTSDDYNGFQGSLTPAVAINVHKGFALNFSFGGIGYRMESYDVAPTTNNYFSATFGQQFNFGISKNIGCHCGKRRVHHDPGMEHRKMKKHDADDDDE